MSTDQDPAGQRGPTEVHRRSDRAVNSALWAAWADALGWISELTDEAGLRRRTRGKPLRDPIAWRRRVGGRSGVDVELPQGTYSDDTQLRLAVCRSIGPMGFDVEVFSRIELPVWPSYALGGGQGTKAAATSMARGDAHWAANRPPGYANAGGNGAAMRVQPHAWRAGHSPESLLMETLRDAIVTHGHPRGVLGAALHALTISDALTVGIAGRPESPKQAWSRRLGQLERLADLPRLDEELAAYWLPNWRRAEDGAPWHIAVQDNLVEVAQQLELAQQVVEVSSGLQEGYAHLVTALSLREPQFRGSGTHTSVAAMALTAMALRHDVHPAQVVRVAVNVLGTDTDTIATMVGAELGCLTDEMPPSPVLDWRYIAAEAERVASEDVRDGAVRYPDLLTWDAPKTQADALVQTDEGLAIVGLGHVKPISEPLPNARGDFLWQFVNSQFGQTFLIKRRKEVATAPANLVKLNPSVRTSIPPERPAKAPKVSTAGLKRKAGLSGEQRALFEAGLQDGQQPAAKNDPESILDVYSLITDALESCRRSDFSPVVVGTLVVRLVEVAGAEAGAAFGALVSRALAERVRGGGGQ